MTRRAKILIWIAVGVITAMGLYIAAVVNTRRQAQKFLATTAQLKIGASTYDDTRHLLEPYRNHMRNSDPCTPNHCTWNFAFRNTLLSALHLAPVTEFTGSLTFEDGLLSTRVEYLGQGTCCVHHIIEGRSLVAPNDRSQPNFSVTLQRTEDGFPSKAIVMLTPQATPEQRQAAYAVDLRCLDKIGGCKSAEELSPQIWRR